MKTNHLAAVLALLFFAPYAVARGGVLGPYTAPGFSIPDNNTVGAQSSIHIPAFDFVGRMDVGVVFPINIAAGAHSWCGDLVARLTFTPDSGAPSRSQYLFNRIGATSEFSRGDSSSLAGLFWFRDGVGSTLWQAAALVGPEQAVPTGFYPPSSRGPDYQYQSVSFVDAFGSSVPSGTWTLNISDHAAGNTGRIVNWGLVPFTPTPGTAMLIATFGASTLRRRRWL
jgi:subtilisin-like proprotein convertase family protein